MNGVFGLKALLTDVNISVLTGLHLEQINPNFELSCTGGKPSQFLWLTNWSSRLRTWDVYNAGQKQRKFIIITPTLTQVSTIKLFYDPPKLCELSDPGSAEYHYGYPKRFIKKNTDWIRNNTDNLLYLTNLLQNGISRLQFILSTRVVHTTYIFKNIFC